MVPNKNKNARVVPIGKFKISKKRVLYLGLGLVVVYACFQLPSGMWPQLINGSPLRADMLGFASLGCAYLLAILLLAPLSPFALMAGGVFGFWWGTLLALSALNAGATVAFFIARYLLPRSWIRRLQEGGRMAALARALAGNGIGTIALLRINPVVPFNLQNYVCGAAGVSFARYSVGTFIGAAPCTIALVYLGHAGRKLFLETGIEVEQWSLLIFLAAAVVTVPITFTVLRETVRRMRECRNNDDLATTKESNFTESTIRESTDKQ